ncbi:hypothetical protein N7493_009731 [Penicillium malachiteum]|uniref:Uncharacterized protein n=1 Tax=Penicillium malachiteum TaxID=1324776 RepID=A0AAD6MSH8_9EURO|nr:hypothetical protein N7493_009731 [Penicillium malachiteum]
MESCKAIAKLESSPDRSDAFRQAMTRYHAAHVSRDLTSILNEGGLCLDAFWKAMATHQEMELGYTPRDLKTTYDQYARLCTIQKDMNKYEGTQNGFKPQYVKQKFSEYIYFHERVRDGKNWPSPLPATFVDRIEEQVVIQGSGIIHKSPLWTPKNHHRPLGNGDERADVGS